ncbi:MAG: hypothetical protein KKD76_01635, partial [Verrucomicrobia bacterium]|nr:hypothetical protein [Verrucomicrobiota bacterium]
VQRLPHLADLAVPDKMPDKSPGRVDFSVEPPNREPLNRKPLNREPLNREPLNHAVFFYRKTDGNASATVMPDAQYNGQAPVICL